MRVTEAVFICSISSISALPTDGKPEFAVVGRSNVGKSSFINLLTGRKQLAKVSATPGKTQTINYFLINNSWYLVDLPGYGYAKVSKVQQQGFGKLIEMYLTKSRNLFCTFVLLDSRLKPQPIDLDFIAWAGKAGIPLALVFTKADKVTKSELKKTLQVFEAELLKQWESLPPVFVTSSLKKTGGNEILDFIASA
ncbi:MAG: ribosome biogenesis GTP-binding protein YihA/YsxC [Cyclobacteriaceae bacterium]|nr:ribosome biogenesis GTP-binding protein YihA/YsxC [Cyclobacteriaceae bacterium]